MIKYLYMSNIEVLIILICAPINAIIIEFHCCLHVFAIDMGIILTG